MGRKIWELEEFPVHISGQAERSKWGTGIRRKTVYEDSGAIGTGDAYDFDEAIRDDLGERRTIVRKVTQGIDENGEVVYETSSAVRPKNKGGFVMVYSQKVTEFIKKCSQPSVIRVFIYIAMNQHHELGGFRASRKHISEALGIDRRSVFNALEYLIDKNIVNEIHVCGQLEYMVNPDYVTVGADRVKRERMWKQRWEIYYREQQQKGSERKCVSESW